MIGDCKPGARKEDSRVKQSDAEIVNLAHANEPHAAHPPVTAGSSPHALHGLIFPPRHGP
jgi:hypothetical protein